MIAILLTFSKEWKRLFLALCGIIIDLFHNLKEHFSSQHQERKQYRKVLGSNYRMLAFLLILTTIPTAVIGGMIQSLVTLTSSNLLAPGVGLYLTAILLVVADMLPEGEKTQKNLKPKDALIAGFFQGFSTIPGLSRLGSTISACVIGGMTRSYAVKYSLIVSVPAIIGATIVEIATMGKTRNRGKALEESGNQCIFRLQIFLRFFSLRKHICHHKQNRRQIQTNARCQQIRGGQCDKALNHAADYSSRDGGQNQQESKHTVVAAEYLPVLLSLLMLTGKVFL
jgi:hypothetical protein